MRYAFLLLFLGLFSPAASFARNSALKNVDRARAMLGPEVWSRIVRIHPENECRSAKGDVYALIFEFSGILWFYDTEGTQSFSRHVGDLESEKADFASLLRAVDPSYTQFQFVESATDPSEPVRGSIVNGCFIESLVALSHRIKSGERIERARLLSYYQDMYGAIIGHTVLTYETSDGAFVIDPQLGPKPTRVARKLSEDAGQVARSFLLPYLLVQARWIDVPVANTSRLARADSARLAKSETELVLR